MTLAWRVPGQAPTNAPAQRISPLHLAYLLPATLVFLLFLESTKLVLADCS